MNRARLKEILRLHDLWLRGQEGGEKAVLSGEDFHVTLRRANLAGADLRGVKLRGSILPRIDLRNADLREADLRDTCLERADLQMADLSGARLQRARLNGACLRYANLQNADLRDADFRDADLRNADLRNADMRTADMQHTHQEGVRIDHLTVGLHPAPEGDLIGWLIAWGARKGHMVKLRIPAEAKRSCATTRSHRCEYAEVLEIEGADEVITECCGSLITYNQGKIVRCTDWDDDRWNELGNGIPFLLTSEEAKAAWGWMLSSAKSHNQSWRYV